MTRDPGFTLVEVLTALVAGGLLLAALGYVVGGLAQDLGAADRNATLHQIEAVAPRLSEMITAAIPPARNDDVLVTRPDLLVMTVPPPQSLGTVGPLRLTLGAEPQNGVQALVARVVALDPDIRLPPSVTAPQTLVTGLKALSFRYQARRNPIGRALPALVTIVFTDGRGRIYPLIAAPRIDVSAACQLDQVSMTCRP